MITYLNIKNIAHYERKTLLRSWFFRIFFIIALFVIVMFNFGLFLIPSAAQWDFRALPASLPFLNVLFVNLAQAIIAIFLASDFLKRDKKLDTAEVIYTRPISNSEYIIGKTMGVLGVFVGMTLVFLVLSLVVNLILTDTPVAIAAYFIYPLLISVPTLVFILGFSYVLMLLIKNQAVTFLVLVGYVALTIFYFGAKFYGIFDYIGFFTPMAYSDMVGFANLELLLAHRLFYLFLGLAFIAATINRFTRLPNTNSSKIYQFALFLLLLLVGLGSGAWFYNKSDSVYDKRDAFLALNNTYAFHKTMDVSSNILNVEHKGSSIEVSAQLKGTVNNISSADTLIFTLNPGLNLSNVSDGHGSLVSYEREKQIIKIPFDEQHLQNDSLSYTFKYSGTINETFCYLDIAEDEFKKNRNVGPINLDKRFSFIQKDLIMLTPESFWYPTPGVGFNIFTLKTRRAYFSNYSVSVNTNPKFTVISQGLNDYELPLKSLSLVVGEYDTLSIRVDSVDYNLFYKPGHDFFTAHFPNLKDTLAYIISDEKSRYDNANFVNAFPYSKIDFVEVPAHFQYFQRMLENTFETVQPGMVLLPEKGIGLRFTDFNRYKRNMNRNAREETRPIDAEVNVFRRLIGRTFFTNAEMVSSSEFRRSFDMPISLGGIHYSLNPYSFFPMYYNYVTGINSNNYPLLDMILSNYLRENKQFDFSAMRGGMQSQERANLLLQESKLSEIISDPKNKALIPEVIIQKGAFLIYGLKYSAGIFDFEDFIYDYVNSSRYSVINVDSLKSKFYKDFEVDIEPFLKLVGNNDDVPAFKLGQTTLTETRDDIGSVYLVKLRVSNISDVKGILDVNFRLAGGGFGGGTSEERIYLFEPHETKEVQIMLYEMPRLMMVNTVISKNIPASYNIFMRTADKNLRLTPEEYEETIDDDVTFYQESEFVVDNEDEGFSIVQENTETKLKQYFDALKNEEEDKYGSVNPYWAPHYWRSVAHTAFNGSIIKSAYYTRQGSGERTATWKTELPSDGIYDVYVYIPRDAMLGRNNSSRGNRQRGGGDRGSGPEFKDEGKVYQYFVFSGEEKEEVEYRLSNVENGWNKIGAFFFTKGDTKIELTNKTDAERVFADAVKWVKRD